MSPTSFGRTSFLLVLAGLCPGPDSFAQAPATPRYDVTLLTPGWPARLNDAGEVAGRIVLHLPYYDSQQAALYRDGAWSGLGVLEDDTASYATDVNNLGVAVGLSSRTFSFSDARYRAIKIENGVVQSVAGLEGKDSSATAINDSGQICGAMGPPEDVYPKPWHAYIAREGSVLDLHGAVEAALGTSRTRTYALDINGRGDVVGYSDDDFVLRIGFLYRSGAATILSGSDPGMTWSLHSPVEVNDAGQVVGTAHVTLAGRPTQALAALFDARTNELIPIPAPAGMGTVITGSAAGIDADGRVVGHQALEGPGGTRSFAFLYENGETVDLNALIPADSGWELQTVTAIGNGGHIVGQGRFEGVSGHYFLLTPANEPPTVTLQGPPSVVEGAELTLTATAADPEGGPLAYEWDLDGDGTYERTDLANEVVLHSADGPAMLEAGVRVADEGGRQAAASIEVQVLNTPPTATLTASATTVYVDTVVGLALVDPSDPGAPDTEAGFSYSWACTAGAGYIAGDATHECAYGQGGVQTARARIADKDGGSSEYAIEVSVRTAEDGVAGLIELVEGLDLGKGMETSFVAKLKAVLGALEAGDTAGACDSLQAFINHAEAQAGKALGPEEASLIIGEAQAIRGALGCG